MQDLNSLSLGDSNILFLANPPYGERIGDKKAVLQLYSGMRQMVGRHADASLAVLSGNMGFERAYGRRAKKKRRFYNGRLECEFMIF